MYCLKVDYHTCSFLNGQIIILNRFLKQFVLKKFKTLIGSLYYFLNLACLYGILCPYYVHQNYIILLSSKYAFGKALNYLQKQCFEKRFENMISRFSKLLKVLSLFFKQSLFVKFLFSFYKWVRSKKTSSYIIE